MGAKFEHFKTICRHRHYVLKECRACGIMWQGIKHDLSKFSRAEFSSSARYFQGNRSPIEAEKEYNGYSIAWLHHKGCNPHHWEYWTDFSDDGEVIANKIPYNYVLEMVCDWIGAGKAYEKEWNEHSPLKYYEEHRKGRYFHKDTERLILRLLNAIDSYGLEGFYLYARSREVRGWYDELGR